MKRIFFISCIAAALAACGNGGTDPASRTDSTTNDEQGSMYRSDTTRRNDTSQVEPNPTQPRDTVRRQ